MSQQAEPTSPVPDDAPEAEAQPFAEAPAVIIDPPEEAARKKSPPEPAPDEEKGVVQQGGLNINAEQIKADKLYAADRQQFINNNIQYLVGGHELVTLKPFSADFLTSISPEAERDILETYISDPTLLQELYATLCEKHLLVLTGEPEIGKTTTALYLGNRLRQVFDHFDGTYLVRPLDRNVKIDFREIMELRYEFSHRLLLFKDAFAGGNRDVLEFFTQMGRPSLGAITEKLQRHQLFLVFTADTETIKSCHRQLSGLSIEGRLTPLSDELLVSGLERKLKLLADTQGLSDEMVEERLPSAQREELIESLRTMPRISNFVDNFFPKLGDDLDWREAVKKIDNLEHWFLSDLTENFEEWCFALTLGLCQCAPYSPGVPWFEFEYFREMISNFLRRKLRTNWMEQPKPSLKETISESLLLERCRAEVYKDPATGADAVRFTNERYPEMLWEMFLTSNRKVLSLLLPQLKTIAEMQTPWKRARAASILGRIGEIDPYQVTFSLIDSWTNSGQPFQLATVGYLYQGIWASRNSNYREDCLKRLSDMATGEERPEVWTAIAAYKQIGAYDLPLAMSKLKEITEQKFAGPIENTQRLERILNRIEQTLDDRKKELSEIDTMALSLYHNILGEIAQRVFSQESRILLAVQYTIVALCLTGDPVQVFDELQKWAAADRESLGALVALIFLEHNGIAAELESRAVETPTVAADGTAEFHLCNLLVLAVASSEDTVRRTARFLAAVYDGFNNFFPRRSCSYFRKSFTLHLKNLVDNSLPVERLRAAIVYLFDELLMSPNPDLRSFLSDLIKYDPDFAHKESKYYPFKKSLQRQRLNLNSRPFSLE